MSGAGAHMVLGAVNFSPALSCEDRMAASIIRLQCENDELRASVALLEEERNILAERFDARLHAVGKTTPETDAAKFETLYGDDNEGYSWGEAVPAEVCRKLERERDEAREALREIQAADWKTSGELRGMARKALEAA